MSPSGRVVARTDTTVWIVAVAVAATKVGQGSIDALCPPPRHVGGNAVDQLDRSPASVAEVLPQGVLVVGEVTLVGVDDLVGDLPAGALVEVDRPGVALGKDVPMPSRFPPEFKRDVVAVARRPESVLAEVCVDFDVSKSKLQRWMAQADIDDGVCDGLTTAEQDELVALRRRTRRLEMARSVPLGDGG